MPPSPEVNDNEKVLYEAMLDDLYSRIRQLELKVDHLENIVADLQVNAGYKEIS